MRSRAPGVCETCGGPTSRSSIKLCGSCARQQSYSPNRQVVAARPPSDASTSPGGRITNSPQAVPDDDALRRAFKHGAALTIAQLAEALRVSPGQALDALVDARNRGLSLHERNGHWMLERLPISLAGERTFEYVSQPDGTYHFGISSDQHLCSRYARQDVLDHLYDEFARAGVDRVFNAGNWIDGEDSKNRFDLDVHGLEPQIRHLVEHYPHRTGITTYAVWGEDHEGWYSRRESIDVGRFAEQQMRAAGREDWVDMGFIEARVDLVHAVTGKRTTLVVMHPGGGSSYAYSYRPQKIVESLSGGEKPGVLIIGHYHKLSCNLIRNVWTLQAGTTMDQSVFMRKKGLEAHVGGFIVTLQQDAETGAIFRCVADQRVYFDRAYYNDRWSKTRPVVQAPKFDNDVRAIR
jgi:hypothetical protein